jgi:hypothetical protein
MTELYRSFNFLDFEASNSALVKYQHTIIKVSDNLLYLLYVNFSDDDFS